MVENKREKDALIYFLIKQLYNQVDGKRFLSFRIWRWSFRREWAVYELLANPKRSL